MNFGIGLSASGGRVSGPCAGRVERGDTGVESGARGVASLSQPGSVKVGASGFWEESTPFNVCSLSCMPEWGRTVMSLLVSIWER
jgi:hypothetical protein